MSAPVYESEGAARRAAARSLSRREHDDPDGESGATRDRVKVRRATANKAHGVLQALALQLLTRTRHRAPAGED